MTLSPNQTQIARRLLTSLIESNKVKADTALRNYRSRDLMPPNVSYEADQRDAETETLQIMLANLHLLTEGAKGRR